MSGNKISDCVSILNQLLKPETILSNSERQELLNFFVEEKIKSIKIYESNLQEKSEQVLSAIKAKKEALVEKEQYDKVVRIRDLEKSYTGVFEEAEKMKQSNLAASFSYSPDGLLLIIADGEYPHTIQELERMGLHLIYFSKTLERMNL